MTHIMLDLETWGKRPGCDIRSIGACVFDPFARTVGISETDNTAFYIATDNPVTSRIGDSVHSRKYRLTRDPETVQWWNDQSEEAQAAFANPVDLHDACLKFGRWLYGTINDARYPVAFSNNIESVKLWANGPQFDVSILDAVYHAVGLPVPWHYRAPRDMRTITDAAGMTRDDFTAFNHGTYHNALDDAISQAMIVCEAYKRLGLQR